jgi:capsular exopolysaccharide synthesis family protein
MSRVYEALRQMQKDLGQPGTPEFPVPVEPLETSTAGPTELHSVKRIRVKVMPSSRLVAFSEPRSLGAEKFRALVTRLENLRHKKEMKSLQITSAVINEGKTLVAANLALTFAKHTGSKVLLLEGDLHRPSLVSLLGLGDLKGLSHWWSEPVSEIEHFVYQLDDVSLWFLGAGAVHEQPSQILQSTRFAEAFNRLTAWFDWVVVDSTPMLPIADVNLWSRLVDGTLLVVREGVASVKALQKGLESLDNLKLIGTVLNEVSESDRTRYPGRYYGVKREKDRKRQSTEGLAP